MFASVILMLSCLSVSTSCGRGRALHPRLVDLSADPSLLRSSMPRVVVAVVACQEQRRWSLVIRPNETITIDLDLGTAPRLWLTGCFREGPEVALTADAGLSAPTLEVGTHSPAAAARSRNVVVDRGKWWSASLELAPTDVALGKVELTLKLTGSRVGDLVLQDVFVESRVASPAATNKPRRILLVSLDTLREDGLSALGGPVSTPNLDALAGESQVFVPHYAAASWTKPSHASLLTGRLPVATGVLDSEDSIFPEIPLISELLETHGFRTFGLASVTAWLDPEWGFGRGFESYRRTDWQIGVGVRELFSLVDQHRDEDLFVFYHAYDPHSDFTRLPYEGPGATTAEVETRFGLPNYGCREGLCASLLVTGLAQGKVEPLAEEGQVLDYLYRQGVDDVDHWIGEFVRWLKESELFDDTLLIVTSDHGEAFLEQPRRAGHGYSWESNLRVPLLIKWPGGTGAGTRVEIPTSAIDIVPTILRHAGLPAGELPGRPLQDAGRIAARPVFSGVRLMTVRRGDYKLWSDGATSHLYDLKKDPQELNDLASAEAEITNSLLELLLRWRTAVGRDKTAPDGTGHQLSEEDRRRLQALGYLDSP